MTPLRLNVHTYLGTVFRVLFCLVISVFGVYLTSIVPQALQQESWHALLDVAFYSLLAEACIVGGLVQAYDWFTEQPLWIEIGPQLTIRTLTDIHTCEWTDIESIRIKHTVHKIDGDDEFDELTYSRSESLVLTRSDLTQVGLGADPYEKRDIIVRTLVEGLSDHEPGTRRYCAEALGRIRSDSLDDLFEEMELMCVSRRADFEREVAVARECANEFRNSLGDAMQQLKTASRDSDADVRAAAIGALCRWEQTDTIPLRPSERWAMQRVVAPERSPMKTDSFKMTALDDRIP